MANKKWYIITAECIRYQDGLSCKVGEVVVLAKVASKSNAYICANALANIYKPELFKINII